MKYLIYARVSPKGSKDKEETSIPLQIQFCREWIKFHGGEVYDVRQDEYSSGKDTNRPAFKTILEELESPNCPWDAIIVYKLSRMTRSLRDGTQIFARLFEKGKGFTSATEHLDFSSPAGRAMLGMMQVFAQFEREQTAENIHNKMVNIASKGLWRVGNPPIGYKRGEKKDNKLYIDERKAEIVKDIFRMYAGEKYRISDILYKYKGIVGKSQIWELLRNPIYRGKLPYDREVYEGQHEAIISEELFKRVQDRLPQKEYHSRPKKQTYPFLLSGLLWCSCENETRLISGTAKSGQYAYYYCQNCKRRYRAEDLEEGIVHILKSMRVSKADQEKAIAHIRKAMEEKEREALPELQSLWTAIKTVETEKEKIFDLLLNTGNNLEVQRMANEKIMRLTLELDGLLSQKKLVESTLAVGANP